MKSMNAGLIALSIMLCAVMSCSDEKNTVQQYGNTLTQSYKSAKKLDKDVNIQQLQQSIQGFNAANGRFPADLNELSSFSGLTLKSENYVYNPLDGTLTENK